MASVCVNPTRCTGDLLLTCCVSKAIFTLLHFTPIQHKISQNTSIPSASGTGLTGAVYSRLRVYFMQGRLFWLSHVATDKILDRETTIKEDNRSINGD